MGEEYEGDTWLSRRFYGDFIEPMNGGCLEEPPENPVCRVETSCSVFMYLYSLFLDMQAYFSHTRPTKKSSSYIKQSIVDQVK